MFTKALSFASASQLLLAVLNQLLSENTQAVIEIFHLEMSETANLPKTQYLAR